MHSKYQELVRSAPKDRFISVYDLVRSSGKAEIQVDIVNNTNEKLSFNFTKDCYYITVDSRQIPLNHVNVFDYTILPFLFIRFNFTIYDPPRKFNPEDIVMIGTNSSSNVLLSNVENGLKGRMIN